MKRRLQTDINAGSMADIAFLLLIFFLVTTTMSTNTGMQRKLPPISDDPPPSIRDRNVMVVLVNKDNVVAIEGMPIPTDMLTEKTKEFLTNPSRNKDLPEFKQKEIPFIGKFGVSKGLISLQTDRNTDYSKYLQVQNELVRAVNELRNELSLNRFKIPYDELSSEKQDAINEAYPLAISEAEPRRIIKDE